MYVLVVKDLIFILDFGCMLQGIIVVLLFGGRWFDKMKGEIIFEVIVIGINVFFMDRNIKFISGGEIKFLELKL